ncbi:GNAT family N-acetyltransferase [Nonomuraea sp. NPDC050310]|uniref:GNAT family N-acetyltransferase n=1 Tax=Nonomuraea sp. NPDC050310 TaxID=3154935 RepID=UPI0033C40845
MWTFTDSVAEYARHAEPYLLKDPVANTVPLTVLANLKAGVAHGADGPYFGWWTEEGKVRGAVFRTPPFPLGLSVMPDHALPPLVEALADRELPSVSGPRALVDRLAAARGFDRLRPERLYGLGTLVEPAGVPGSGRVAADDDLALVTLWATSFSTESGTDVGIDLSQLMAKRLARGDMVVWEADGEPVAMAGVSPAVGGVCRIGPVYTPPSARRRGYGSAVTAFASRHALAHRCEHLVLFTDLANPTSNKIYQSIGFRPVADYANAGHTR